MNVPAPSLKTPARGLQLRASEPQPGRRPTKPPAYILLELVIALSIFAIAVLSLANSLSSSVEVANLLNRDAAVRIAMRSFIEELRIRPLADMTTSTTDPHLGIVLTSEMEPLGLRSGRGNTLNDLYNLTVTATYSFGGEQRSDTISLYIHKPR
jgi:type II secretory pathway pseudopilin PulG